MALSLYFGQLFIVLGFFFLRCVCLVDGLFFSFVYICVDLHSIDHLRAKLRIFCIFSQQLQWMVGKTNEEIRDMALNILRLVDSPHPVSIGVG